MRLIHQSIMIVVSLQQIGYDQARSKPTKYQWNLVHNLSLFCPRKTFLLVYIGIIDININMFIMKAVESDPWMRSTSIDVNKHLVKLL